MKSANHFEKGMLLAEASTADVYAWGDDQVLKLYNERSPWHTNEIAATKFAGQSGFPVPEVANRLIDVGEQEGIIFERINGPTMTEFVEEHPDEVEICAQQAAKLQVRIHSTEVTELPPLVQILTWSIGLVDSLEEKTRKTVLDVLNGLPPGEVLTHNDYHPNNIIVSSDGLVVIDWATGTRGRSLADLARTWLISKLWLDGLVEKVAPEHLHLVWQRFWNTYFQQYEQLYQINSEELNRWQIVIVTSSLVWGPPITINDQRVSFIEAALSGRAHPWFEDQ